MGEVSAGGELVALEDEVAARLDVAARAALETVRTKWVPADMEHAVEYRALASESAFLQYSRVVLGVVAQRARDLHAGKVGFVADKLFTPEESAVAERALSAALTADAPWARDVLTILTDVSVAPTDSKAAPSQAMCFALARAMRDCPTPEAVAMLRATARVARHAGIRKKLDRYHAAARRNLTGRRFDRIVEDAAIGDSIRWRNQRAKPKSGFATGSKVRHPDYPFKAA